jgi:hypothetical protein
MFVAQINSLLPKDNNKQVVKQQQQQQSILRKNFRQHIFQTVYDQYWSQYHPNSKKKAAAGFFKINKPSKLLKLENSSYILRCNENLFSWKILMHLPMFREYSGMQLQGMFDMLKNIETFDDDESTGESLSMSIFNPLIAWVEQIQLNFEECYALLLYIWVILDVQLPLPPYQFVLKAKPKPKLKPQPNLALKPKPKSKPVAGSAGAKQANTGNNNNNNSNSNSNKNKKKNTSKSHMPKKKRKTGNWTKMDLFS